MSKKRNNKANVDARHLENKTDQQPPTREEKQLASHSILNQLRFGLRIFSMQIHTLIVTMADEYFRIQRDIDLISNITSEEEAMDLMVNAKETRGQSVVYILAFQTRVIFALYIVSSFLLLNFKKRALQKAIEKVGTLSDLEKLRNKISTTNHGNFLFAILQLFLHSFWPIILALFIQRVMLKDSEKILRNFIYIFGPEQRGIDLFYNRCLNQTQGAGQNCMETAMLKWESARIDTYNQELLYSIAGVITSSDSSMYELAIINILFELVKKIYVRWTVNSEKYTTQQSLKKQAQKIENILINLGYNKKQATCKIINYNKLSAINLTAPKNMLNTIVQFLKLSAQKIIVNDAGQYMVMLYENFQLPHDTAINDFTKAWKLALNAKNNFSKVIEQVFHHRAQKFNITADQNWQPVFEISIQTPAAHYLKTHLKENGLDVAAYGNQLILSGDLVTINTFFQNKELIKTLLESYDKKQTESAQAQQARWTTQVQGTFFTTQKLTKTNVSMTKNASDSDDEIEIQAAAGPAKDEAPSMPAAFQTWATQHNRPVYPSYNNQGMQTLLFFATALRPQGEEQEAIAKKLEDPKGYVHISAGSTGKSGIKQRPGETRYSFKTGGHNAVFNAVTDDKPVATTEAGEALWIFNKFVKVH